MFNRIRSKQDPVHWVGSGVPQNGGKGHLLDLLRSKRGSYSLGGVWHTAKRDSTRYCSSPPSTSSSLHGLLLIHRRPPLASTCDCSSTGSCSSSLHCALLHRLLFNQPFPRGSCSTTPPWATVHPALHRLLFILLSTGLSCSSSPPRGPVHPAPTSSIDRGPVHLEATLGVLFIQPSTRSCSSTGSIDRGPVHPTPTVNCSSTPPTKLTIHPEAASIGFS